MCDPRLRGSRATEAATRPGDGHEGSVRGAWRCVAAEWPLRRCVVMPTQDALRVVICGLFGRIGRNAFIRRDAWRWCGVGSSPCEACRPSFVLRAREREGGVVVMPNRMRIRSADVAMPLLHFHARCSSAGRMRRAITLRRPAARNMNDTEARSHRSRIERIMRRQRGPSPGMDRARSARGLRPAPAVVAWIRRAGRCRASGSDR